MTQPSIVTKILTAGALLLVSSLSAFAVEATATVDLNVRTGPGTNFGIIDTLEAGELVDTTECQSSGWCYIEQAEQNGWVSSNFLQAVPPPSADPAAQECELRLTFGAGGPKLELICEDVSVGGTPLPAPPPPPPPVGDEACFYRDANYQGPHFCYAVGQLNSLNAQFNDRISSVRLNGAVRAQLCVNTNLGGYCSTFADDAPILGALINNRASSLKVYNSGVFVPIPLPFPIPVPPLVPANPGTFKSAAISVPSSFAFNLDNGHVGSGSGVDLWYHAINAAVRRLEPRHGATVALGDGSNRGFSGCWGATYSGDPIAFSHLTVGTYVCVKTNEGRISQFRVNGYDGTTLKIGFTTFRRP